MCGGVGSGDVWFAGLDAKLSASESSNSSSTDEVSVFISVDGVDESL